MTNPNNFPPVGTRVSVLYRPAGCARIAGIIGTVARHLEEGQKVEVLAEDNRLRVIPAEHLVTIQPILKPCRVMARGAWVEVMDLDDKTIMSQNIPMSGKPGLWQARLAKQLAEMGYELALCQSMSNTAAITIG